VVSTVCYGDVGAVGKLALVVDLGVNSCFCTR
jgi:hypothetical protein